MAVKVLSSKQEVQALIMFEDMGFRQDTIAQTFDVSTKTVKRAISNQRKIRSENPAYAGHSPGMSSAKQDIDSQNATPTKIDNRKPQKTLPGADQERLKYLQSKSLSEIRNHFGDQMQYTLDKLVTRGITDEKIDKANLRDTAISMGIIADKMALMKNITATEKVDHRVALVGKVRVSQDDE